MEENINEFVIEETAQDVAVEIDLLDELANYDFTNAENSDVEKYFNVLKDAEEDNDEYKKNEAVYIIEELGPKYLDKEYLEILKKSKDNLTNFIKKYDAESEVVKSMSETDKDKIFAIGKFLNQSYMQKINELTFNFELSVDEYKFIQTAIRSKLTYNGTEVFNMVELKGYLDLWEVQFKALPKNTKSFFVTIDIRNVVMLYHFLNKHSVKGIDKEFHLFMSVLQKIGDTNRLFNAYNIVKERENTNFIVWTGSITPMEVENLKTELVEEPNKTPVEKPKKKKTK